jgi:hypothetical protein
MDAKKKARLRRDIKSLVESSIAPLVNECITQRLTQFAEHIDEVRERSGLSDAECDAIYQAVTMANLRRDVKAPEQKRQIIRNALGSKSWHCTYCGNGGGYHAFGCINKGVEPATHTPEDSAGKDGERYRWLRDHRFDFIARNNGSKPQLHLPAGALPLNDAGVDALIDAAREATQDREGTP